MVADITKLVTEYEERVQRMQKVPRFSHGCQMLPVIIFRLEF